MKIKIPFSSTRKYLFLLIAALHINFIATASIPTLSPMAEISLLTCSSGPELYKTFGHNAIRVRDPFLRLDRVYNYGTFDFNTENFYMKFARGKLDYWLSVGRFEDFLYEYAHYNQTVYENEFNLTQAEKQQLFDFLETNYLPENRFYLYDFFYDNCATRIRDAVYVTFENRVEIADSSWHKDISFREGLDLYITNQPWSHLGMDLGLGIPADKKMDINGIMFLPEYLILGLESMILTTETGEKPLLRPRRTLYEGSDFGSGTGEFNYLFVLLLLIAFTIIYKTYREFQLGVHSYKTDNWVFLFPMIIALVQLLLWFGTDHKTTKFNPDLLWTLPAFILLFIKKRKVKDSLLFRYGLIISISISLFYLVLWSVFRINFNLMILPLIILVLVRMIKLFMTTRELKPQKVKI